MNLREWLFRKRRKVTDFAKEVGVSRNHINMIVNDHAKPGAGLAAKIEAATNGEVTLRELLFPEQFKENK